MALYACIGLLLALVSAALPSAQSAALDQQIAFVKELEPVGHAKREVQLLPDNLNLELSAEKTIQLNLKRIKNINHNHVKVTFDDPTLNKKDLNLNKYNIGYYQDSKKMASISIEAKIDGASIQRTLTGTLVYNGKLYELVPASEELQKIDDILEEKGLGEEHSHRVHVLKEVNKKLLEVNDKHIYKTMEEKQHSQSSKKEHESDKVNRLLQIILNMNLKIGKYDDENQMETDDDDKGADDSQIQTDDDDNQKQTDDDDNPKQTNMFDEHQVIHVQNMFCIDYDIWKSFFDKFGEDAEKRLVYYFHQILNGVYLLYANIDDENLEIVIWLTRLHIITNEDNMVVNDTWYLPEQSSQTGVDSYNGMEIVNHLYEFREQQKIAPTDIDTLILFTRKPLYLLDVTGITYSLRGLAVGVCKPMCTSDSNAIIFDVGFTSSHTTAHEIGHLLGSFHDDLIESVCPKNALNIMHNGEYAKDADNINTAFLFADCSIDYIKRCISGTYPEALIFMTGTGVKTCLFNKECRHHQTLQDIDVLPGTRFTVDRQCELFWASEGLKSCSPTAPEICLRLECSNSSDCSQLLGYTDARAAHGTLCDSADHTKVCYFGRCISRSEVPDSAIDDLACEGEEEDKPAVAISEKETVNDELEELQKLKKDIDQVINGKKKKNDLLDQLKRLNRRKEEQKN